MDQILEELMAGLYGNTGAPGVGGGYGTPPADPDPRRGAAGGSVGGPSMSLARLLPFLMGLRGPNMAGGGINAIDPRNMVGGANVAPGADQGRALGQPGANPTPGAPSAFGDRAGGGGIGFQDLESGGRQVQGGAQRGGLASLLINGR